MVVAPALAEGQQRHPPVVPRAVASLEPPLAPEMSGRVRQPGWRAGRPTRERTRPRQGMASLQRRIAGPRGRPAARSGLSTARRERSPDQVRRIPRTFLEIAVSGVAHQHPDQVRPPSALPAACAGRRACPQSVKHTVCGNPEERATFERQGSRDSQESTQTTSEPCRSDG